MVQFIIILLIGVLAYIIYDFVLTKRANKKYGVSAIIKSTYEKVLVPVNKINILARDYYEDNESDLFWVEAMDSLDRNKNIRSVHKYISVITYDDFVHLGKKYSFRSIPIALSEAEIRDKLTAQENLTIYYDQNDLTKYRFDLYFLF